MAHSLTKKDVDSLLEVSRNESSILEPFVEKDKKQSSKPDNKKMQLWPAHSAPPLTDSTSNGNPKKAAWSSSSASSSSSSPREPPSPFAKDDGPSALLKALMGLGIYLIVGIVCFSFLHNELGGSVKTTTLVDALYFAIVTMTTVGYGDIVPSSTEAKLFTCVFVFIGFGLIGALVSGLANYLVEKQEKILVQKVYNKYRKKKEEEQDDGVITAQWKAMVAGVLVLVLFVLGLLVLHYWEGMSLMDAFYCVCVTVTTLGYGDQSFNTEHGRIFALFWILASTVCVAQFFLYLAEMRTEERQHRIAHWALCRRTTTSDLEAADLDGDGVVSKAEFLIFKLKECGKIEQADLVDFVKEFNELDYDHSGTLCASDLHFSQQSGQTERSASAA